LVIDTESVPAVVLVPDGVADLVQVDRVALDHHFLARRVAHDARRHQPLGPAAPLLVEVAPLVDAERGEEAAVGPEQVGEHRDVRALDALEEQRRRVRLQADAREAVDLPPRVDLVLDAHELAQLLQVRDELAHVVPVRLAHEASSDVVLEGAALPRGAPPPGVTALATSPAGGRS
jgi:predicted TIM-barrel fold metal-dependent hydrolase